LEFVSVQLLVRALKPARRLARIAFRFVTVTTVTVHGNALERSRKLELGVPLYGVDGIPIRDEIELETIV
jgi:hypothetical protein